MRYIFGILGVIFVAILAIILISSRGDRPQDQSGSQKIVVSEQNNEHTSVRLTNQGRLVGEDQRRAIRVTVNETERKLEILTGYEETVERSTSYPNTPTAYETFLVALDKAGFSRERATVNTDERGACPLGRRYIYELMDSGEAKIHLWDTTCGSKIGTFAGDESTIRRIFQQQIPDYLAQTKGVKL